MDTASTFSLTKLNGGTIFHIIGVTPNTTRDGRYAPILSVLIGNIKYSYYANERIIQLLTYPPGLFHKDLTVMELINTNKLVITFKKEYGVVKVVRFDYK